MAHGMGASDRIVWARGVHAAGLADPIATIASGNLRDREDFRRGHSLLAVAPSRPSSRT